MSWKDTPNSVSYTHLDVYKRQPSHTREMTISDAPAAVSQPSKSAGTDGMASVSYTHLDVYKRQALLRSKALGALRGLFFTHERSFQRLHSPTLYPKSAAPLIMSDGA